MKMYGGKQLADSFRGVRANTITIAEEIPEDQYGFRPVPGVKSVAEQLAHIAVATGWQIEVHTAEVSHIDFAMFGASLARGASEEQAMASKSAIVAALKERGAQFASFLEGLGEAQLEQKDAKAEAGRDAPGALDRHAVASHAGILTAAAVTPQAPSLGGSNVFDAGARGR